MRPAGLLPNIAKLVPPWGRPKIARNADPFMKGNPNQVEAANLSHQPIANRVFRHFRREGAKHPIPDDEDAGIIAVKIARVGRVMDAVVGAQWNTKEVWFGATVAAWACTEVVRYAMYRPP